MASSLRKQVSTQIRSTSFDEQYIYGDRDEGATIGLTLPPDDVQPAIYSSTSPGLP